MSGLKKMAKVLIVGSGLTGAASAAILKQQVPGISKIEIWDKARGAGGRMSTSRCPEDGAITADLGAQYITMTPEYIPKRQKLYEELMENGVLAPLKGKIEGPNNFNSPGSHHFVTPRGSSSIVKYFLKKADCLPNFQRRVREVSFSDGGKIDVSTYDDESGTFDALILTIPVPQILELRGSIHDAINNQVDVKQKLQKVTYSSRFALALFYPPKTELSYPWCAQYVPNDDCIRYVAIDQEKRGEVRPSDGKAVVVHTSVPYGLAHIDQEPCQVKDEILAKLRAILPNLPEPMSVKPQKWRYSQVYKEYDESPGCVVLSVNPLVILAGDAFAHSTFDGCMDSAEAVVEAVKTQGQYAASSSSL